MAAKRQATPKSDRTHRPPATTPEIRERQMIGLAVDLAEQQIREGTVSAQVLSHYLKMASTREQLEMQKLSNENQLLQARIEEMGTSKRVEELYGEALNAMRSYAGQPVEDLEDD